MKKYSESVKQLEDLLELEKETLVIKRKVATFSLDYDDDLVIYFIRSDTCISPVIPELSGQVLTSSVIYSILTGGLRLVFVFCWLHLA